MKKYILATFVFVYVSSSLAFDPFKLDLKDPERVRGTYLAPIASFFIPGFDQWWEGQTDGAILYTGLAVSGFGISATSGYHTNTQANTSAAQQLSTGSDSARANLFGSKLYETAGDLSLYHSFRSAVRTRQQYGQYSFLHLENEETTDKLLMAPFQFSFLQRPTTFLPLGFALLSVALAPAAGHQIWLSDGFYATSTSYCAGVGEEALFRGYIMPQFMEGLNSPFWSNTATAVIFGAAHLASDNKVPVGQFLFGWYEGWLSQKNNWTLSEGIFIHAWWDTILLLYQLSDHTPVAQPVMLPLLNARF
jgi:hypothetical protein